MKKITITLPDRIVTYNAENVLKDLLKNIREQMQHYPGIMVDLYIDAGALIYFDSSAIAVLIQCRIEALNYMNNFGKEACIKNKQATLNDCFVKIHGLPTKLYNLSRAYGVESLLFKS